jgi:hypothetical protein
MEVKASTLDRYRKALQLFLKFLADNRYVLFQFCEFDDLAVEYKHVMQPSKSNFEGLIAALEYVLPAIKGHLPWSRAVISAWAVTYQPKHTVPMSEGPAVYIGCHFSCGNHPRLGAGVILQEALGLRPSEMLDLWRKDVALPEDHGGDYAILGLGVRAGTKAKRAQTVLPRGHKKIALSCDGYVSLWLVVTRSPHTVMRATAGYLRISSSR